MFKKVTPGEQVRRERAGRLKALGEQATIEEALLETSIAIAEEQAKNLQNEQAILELTILIGGE